MNKELKAEIVKKYGTQFAFANSIGWRESIVSRVIRGYYTLNDDEKKIWSKAIGKNINKLLKGAVSA